MVHPKRKQVFIPPTIFIIIMISLIIKIISLIIEIISLIISLLILKYDQIVFTSLLLCFGAGVLLCTALLHIMPEVGGINIGIFTNYIPIISSSPYQDHNQFCHFANTTKPVCCGVKFKRTYTATSLLIFFWKLKCNIDTRKN